jgi:hypothetical protein
MRMRGAGYGALGAAASLVVIATVAHAAIGTAVSVAPSATNSRGGASRPLAAQDPLEQNDRIRTTGQGAVQTRFNDDTTLTIGPNSEVVLDRYVFDGARARNVTVQVVRGALRFVSGKSPSEVYQIKTPVATIGVRGTTVNLLLEGNRLILETPYGFSTICLTGTTNCRDLGAGGAALSIGPGGFAPASAGDAARMNRALQQAQIQLAQQGGGEPKAGSGSGTGNSNVSDSSNPLNTAPPVVPAATFIPNAVNTGPPTGPGPAFPDFISVFRVTGAGSNKFNNTSSVFDSCGNSGNCGGFAYALRSSAVWDPGTDSLRAATISDFPNPADDPNPTRITRGTARIIDLYTGTANVPGFGIVPIYQLFTWTDGNVFISQAGSSNTVDLSPNDAFSVIAWGYTGLLFDTPISFGRTVMFNLERASVASWSDGRAPFGSFSGTAAVSIAASGLSYGLSATVTMSNGTFALVTPGGTAAPWLSGAVGNFDGRFSAHTIFPVTGPASFCTTSCFGDVGFNVIFGNKIAVDYHIFDISNFGFNDVEVGGVAVFAAASSNTTPLAALASFAGVFPISTGGNAGASGILEPDASFGAVDNLVLREVDLVSGQKRIRDTARVDDRGFVAGIIAWERWTEGKVKDDNNTIVTLSANQGLHLITGTPATNVPTGGTYTYDMIGGTKPTITDGSVAPGALNPNSRVAVAFAPLITNSRVGVDLNVGIGGGSYNILTPGGVSNPNLSAIALTATGGFSGSAIPVTFTGTGTACPSTCTASVDGFIAGNFATHLGIVYQFGTPSTPSKAVVGAGAFGRSFP